MPPKVTRDPPTTDEQARLELAAQWELCLPRFRSVVAPRIRRVYGKVTDELVSDLIAEVTRQLLAKASEYDPLRGLIAYAAGFAFKILSGRRRRARRERRQTPATDLAGRHGHDFMERILDRQSGGPAPRLREWLERLPDADRLVIECRFFRNLTARETAEVLGLRTAGAARTRLARALSLLRAAVAEDMGGAP